MNLLGRRAACDNAASPPTALHGESIPNSVPTLCVFAQPEFHVLARCIIRLAQKKIAATSASCRVHSSPGIPSVADKLELMEHSPLALPVSADALDAGCAAVNPALFQAPCRPASALLTASFSGIRSPTRTATYSRLHRQMSAAHFAASTPSMTPTRRDRRVLSGTAASGVVASIEVPRHYLRSRVPLYRSIVPRYVHFATSATARLIAPAPVTHFVRVRAVRFKPLPDGAVPAETDAIIEEGPSPDPAKFVLPAIFVVRGGARGGPMFRDPHALLAACRLPRPARRISA